MNGTTSGDFAIRTRLMRETGLPSIARARKEGAGFGPAPKSLCWPTIRRRGPAIRQHCSCHRQFSLARLLIGELILKHHAGVTVEIALYLILEKARSLGQ